MKNIIFILLCFLAVSCARDINNDSYQLSLVGTAGQIGESVVLMPEKSGYKVKMLRVPF